MHSRHPVYDCIYVALAVDRDSVLVTADSPLVRAFRGGPGERWVRWIEEA